jgi:hypothetical protein
VPQKYRCVNSLLNIEEDDDEEEVPEDDNKTNSK